MIYHQKRTGTPTLRCIEWWAIDSDTLTMALCRVEKGPRFFMEILRPPRSPDAETSHAVPPDTGEGAIAILMDCRKHFKLLANCPAALSLTNEPPAETDEYLLVGQVGEIPDCVMHTRDPLFIARYANGAPPKDAKESFVAFSSASHLPPRGWEYWSTDARQEIGRLLEEYIQVIQRTLHAPLPVAKKRQLTR